MASKAPPIPAEQRARPDDRPDIGGSDIGRRDHITGLQSEQPGDDDVNLQEQGRQGNIAQNTRHPGSRQRH